MKNYNKYIDHTYLKANATRKDIDKLVDEAIKYDFMSVCVNPYFIKYAKKRLEGSTVKVCTVVGFPLGQNTVITKIFEAKNAVENGADEIDMVINISALKDGLDSYVYEEIRAVREVTKGKVLKVILETCLLTDEEIKKASEIATKAGVDFVKTSTGFAENGATVRAINIMKDNIGENVSIKASGGIRDAERARLMIDSGAERIGASASVSIVGGGVLQADD